MARGGRASASRISKATTTIASTDVVNGSTSNINNNNNNNDDGASKKRKQSSEEEEEEKPEMSANDSVGSSSSDQANDASSTKKRRGRTAKKEPEQSMVVFKDGGVTDENLLTNVFNFCSLSEVVLNFSCVSKEWARIISETYATDKYIFISLEQYEVSSPEKISIYKQAFKNSKNIHITFKPKQTDPKKKKKKKKKKKQTNKKKEKASSKSNQKTSSRGDRGNGGKSIPKSRKKKEEDSDEDEEEEEAQTAAQAPAVYETVSGTPHENWLATINSLPNTIDTLVLYHADTLLLNDQKNRTMLTPDDFMHKLGMYWYQNGAPLYSVDLALPHIRNLMIKWKTATPTFVFDADFNAIIKSMIGVVDKPGGGEDGGVTTTAPAPPAADTNTTSTTSALALPQAATVYRNPETLVRIVGAKISKCKIFHPKDFSYIHSDQVFNNSNSNNDNDSNYKQQDLASATTPVPPTIGPDVVPNDIEVWYNDDGRPEDSWTHYFFGWHASNSLSRILPSRSRPFNFSYYNSSTSNMCQELMTSFHQGQPQKYGMGPIKMTLIRSQINLGEHFCYQHLKHLRIVNCTGGLYSFYFALSGAKAPVLPPNTYYLPNLQTFELRNSTSESHWGSHVERLLEATARDKAPLRKIVIDSVRLTFSGQKLKIVGDHLEEVRITNVTGGNSDSLGSLRCPKLKLLDLSGCTLVHDDFIDALAESELDSLRELNLDGCTSLRNPLIRITLPSLEVLHLPAFPELFAARFESIGGVTQLRIQSRWLSEKSLAIIRASKGKKIDASKLK